MGKVHLARHPSFFSKEYDILIVLQFNLISNDFYDNGEYYIITNNILI